MKMCGEQLLAFCFIAVCCVWSSITADQSALADPGSWRNGRNGPGLMKYIMAKSMCVTWGRYGTMRQTGIGSVMRWECSTVLLLCLGIHVFVTLTQITCINIVTDQEYPFMTIVFSDGNERLLHPAYGKLAQEWFAKDAFSVPTWPPNSWDLSLIRHLVRCSGQTTSHLITYRTWKIRFQWFYGVHAKEDQHNIRQVVIML